MGIEGRIISIPEGSHFWLAYVYIALGNFDKAIDELEIDYEEHGIWMCAANVDPLLDPIRNHPRFRVIMKKMNFN